MLRSHMSLDYVSRGCCLVLLGSKGHGCLSGTELSFFGFVMSTPRLRHRPQVEDEDAAALKLGSGTQTQFDCEVVCKLTSSVS